MNLIHVAKKSSDSCEKSTQKCINRTTEKCLEEATLSGVLKLSGRKLRDVAKLGSRNYNLADIYKADLSKNRLTELPFELTDCPSLETMNLYQNNIKSLPQEIIYLQSLTFLDLSRNQLSVLPPCLSQLPLQVLLVSHNKLVSIPEEFGRLASLLEFDVSCNEISHVPPQLGSLPKLQSLSLRRNLLVHIPIELTELKLRSLDLGENRLETLPTELRNMKTLETLRLDCNPLRSPPAYLCARGLVHVFKFLETLAAKEDRTKNSSVSSSEPQRKLSQMCDLRLFETCRSLRPSPSTVGNSVTEKIVAKEVLENDTGSVISTFSSERSLKVNGSSSRIPGAMPLKEKQPSAFSPSLLSPTSPTAEPVNGFESRIPGLRNGNGTPKTPPDGKEPPQTYRQYKESLKQQRENVYIRQKSNDSSPTSNGVSDHSPTTISPPNIKPSVVKEQQHSGPSSFLHHVAPRTHPTHLVNGHTHPFPHAADTGQKPTAPRPPEPHPIRELPSVNNHPETPMRGRLDQGPIRHDIPPIREPLYNHAHPETPMRTRVDYGPQTRLTAQGAPQPPLPAGNPPVHRMLPNPHRHPVKSGSRIPPPNPVALVSYKNLEGNMQEQITALRQCIESRLKVSLPEDLGSALSDGVVLCHLANSVRPRSVSSIHVPSPAVPKLPLPKSKRNIENFVEACRKIGVEEACIMTPDDLLDAGWSPLSVLTTVLAVLDATNPARLEELACETPEALCNNDKCDEASVESEKHAVESFQISRHEPLHRNSYLSSFLLLFFLLSVLLLIYFPL